MTVFLVILLSLAVFAILFGHWILSAVDRLYLYPKRLANVLAKERVYPPSDQLPEVLPPATVAQLVFFDNKKGKSYTPFTVTLLDLVRRQKIYVTPKDRELYFSPLGDDSDLLPFEKTVVNFLRTAAGERKYISLTDLKTYIDEHRGCAAEMRSRFLREVADDFLSRGYSGEVDYDHRTHPLVLIGQIAVAVSAGTLLGWIAGNIPLGVISVSLTAVAISLCLQVFCYKLSYLTEDGKEMQARWLSYGEYLRQLTPEKCTELSAERFVELAVYAAAIEQSNAFTAFSVVGNRHAEDMPECKLYDPYYYKKLTQIDYSILILSVRPEDAKDLKFDE